MTTPGSRKTKHPSKRQLTDFLNGKLLVEHQAVMERHVANCENCCQSLEFITDDELGDRLLTIATQFEPELTRFDSGFSSAESEQSFTCPANELDSNSIPLELRNLERYELTEKIATGGMGDVYRARQTSMDREVAIKVMRRHLFENDRAIARFKNEARIAAKLNHPNIVHSYDADVANGTMILVMELVEGKKLSDYVRERGQLPPDEACSLTKQIVDGLAYAGKQGMIHRDIKPQNILIQENEAIKITDFGLAKFMQDSAEGTNAGLTVAGETFGTPDYVAPEQIRDSSAADCRSDIYSLGCTLYFMLTGRPPFVESSVGEKLAGHLDRTPDSVACCRPDIPASLVAVVEKMMQKSRGERYQDYAEVTSAIDNFLNEGAEPRSREIIGLPHQRLTRKKANGMWKIAACVMVGVFLLVGLLSLGWNLWPDGSGGLANYPSSNSGPAALTSPGKKHVIAIVVPSKNAYHPEISGLYGRLIRQADIEIQFVAERHGLVKFAQQKSNQLPKSIQIEKTLSELSSDDCDAIIFTGAWNGKDGNDTRYAFEPSLNRQAKRFAEEMLAKRKPVAAVCGGTVVLAKADILRGKRAANCRYIDKAIKNESAAIWSPELRNDTDAIVVEDGFVVTGGNAINCPEIADRILAIVTSRR